MVIHLANPVPLPQKAQLLDDDDLIELYYRENTLESIWVDHSRAFDMTGRCFCTYEISSARIIDKIEPLSYLGQELSLNELIELASSRFF